MRRVHGWPPIAFGLLTACSTLTGGLAALRLSRRREPLTAFSGGVVIGVALLLVLPEAVELLGDRAGLVGVAAAIGFLSFFSGEKLLLLRRQREAVGILGAAGLSFHSFIDGLGIGLALSAGSGVAVLLLLAVVSHDFADGLNTVTLVLSQGNPARRAVTWLCVDAATPLAGVLVGSAFHLPEPSLGALLGFYVGFFLHVGTADLLPRGFAHPTRRRLLLTLSGVGLAALVGRLAH